MSEKRMQKKRIGIVTAALIMLLSACGQSENEEIRQAVVVEESVQNTPAGDAGETEENAAESPEEKMEDVFEPGMEYRDNPVAKLMVGKTVSYTEEKDYYTAISYLAEPEYMTMSDIKDSPLGAEVISSTGDEYEKTGEAGEQSDIFNVGSVEYWEINEMSPFYNGRDGYVGLGSTFSYDPVFFNRDDSPSELRIRKDAIFQKIDPYNEGIDPKHKYTAEKFIKKGIAEEWESEQIDGEEGYRKNYLYLLHFDDAGYVDTVTLKVELCEREYLLADLEAPVLDGIFALHCYEITKMELEKGILTIQWEGDGGLEKADWNTGEKLGESSFKEIRANAEATVYNRWIVNEFRSESSFVEIRSIVQQQREMYLNDPTVADNSPFLIYIFATDGKIENIREVEN